METKGDIEIEGYATAFWAADDDLVVRVTGDGASVNLPSMHVTVFRQAPRLAPAAAAAGLLLGLLAGWLLAGWALRAHARHRPWGQNLMLAAGLIGLIGAAAVVVATGLGALLLASTLGWSAQDSLVPAGALLAGWPMGVMAVLGLLSCAVLGALVPRADRTALPRPVTSTAATPTEP